MDEKRAGVSRQKGTFSLIHMDIAGDCRFLDRSRQSALGDLQRKEVGADVLVGPWEAVLFDPVPALHVMMIQANGRSGRTMLVSIGAGPVALRELTEGVLVWVFPVDGRHDGESWGAWKRGER